MELATLHFDTYKAVNLLKEKGFTKKQSEGIMEVIQEVTLSGVATKDDIHRLENRFAENLKFQIIQTVAIIGVMVALFALFS